MGEINYERHKRREYSDPSPYPQIKVLSPNIHYANLLMDDYAGVVSEFTAINQYLYHYFFFKDIDEKLGTLLENVSINEMLHMEILAETIKKLGGNPIIRGSHSTQGNYWSGRFVYYGTHVCDQLKADIDAEHKAIQEYRKHIHYIQDPFVQAILERVILDEIVHIRLFNQVLLQFCGYEYKQYS
ncbi:MAG: bacterioferritin [Gracilibacter sp. BRH_c7a]|nr:MAG: bacterioferritin [Gracilibacter sp. BRH_c7a]